MGPGVFGTIIGLVASCIAFFMTYRLHSKISRSGSIWVSFTKALMMVSAVLAALSVLGILNRTMYFSWIAELAEGILGILLASYLIRFVNVAIGVLREFLEV